MTEWLEFHDSILTGVDARETRVELLLDAYIHRWEKHDEQWRGTGWMQGVRIVVSNVVGPLAMPVLPAEIAVGWLRRGAVAHNDLVRLPLEASAVISISLQLNTDDVVEFTGSAVRIEATTDARYVEELPADMRPQDPD